MRYRILSKFVVAGFILAISGEALQTDDRLIKANYTIEYLKTPGEVETLTEMFTKGDVYGRLRSNMFWWDWENNNLAANRDNNAWGAGGSIVYKTGFYKGFGATAGFYGTVPLHHENTVDGSVTNFGKAGKDTYHTRADGSEGSIGVFAEAYAEYKAGKTDLKIGRQIIESVMLASNDGKMIPNTFEAAMIENKDIPDTTVHAGYIMSQKLRDHQSFHSIIAFEKYNQNDDSGVHKGLTPFNIHTKGAGDIDPEMILLTASNKSITNLKLYAEYVGLKGFFNTAIAEVNYQIALGDGWTLTPGIRYLKQMDDGAGVIGGASLNGKVTEDGASKGYKDGNNADGSIFMERLVLAKGPFALMAGYSKVADDGDIIAPWRGFPTGGYTRSMAQLDWVANTESWMVKADYDFGKAGLIPGFKAFVDYADMNFDEAKIIPNGTDFSDHNILHIDLLQEFKAIPNAEFKFRFATVNADPSSKTGLTADYESYDEYRFEVNYLF